MNHHYRFGTFSMATTVHDSNMMETIAAAIRRGDQQWIFRCLLRLGHGLTVNRQSYKSMLTMLPHTQGNRYSVPYWLSWMSKSAIPLPKAAWRNEDPCVFALAIAASIRNNVKYTQELTGNHLENAKEFLLSPCRSGIDGRSYPVLGFVLDMVMWNQQYGVIQ